MSTCLYFAYGSNLLTTRLLARCPSAIVKGVAIASDWEVRFTKPGADGSGKAGLFPEAGAEQSGVIYEMALDEMPILDKYEGLGIGYTRDDSFQVQIVSSGATVLSTTYLPIRYNNALLPFDWYLALCVAGALEHGLDDHIIETFRSSPHQHDEDEDRKARLEGIAALKAAGHHDWRELL